MTIYDIVVESLLLENEYFVKFIFVFILVVDCEISKLESNLSS